MGSRCTRSGHSVWSYSRAHRELIERLIETPCLDGVSMDALEAIEISVWGEMTSTIAPLLVEAANKNAVLLARRLKITRYGVVSLRAKNSTSFALNPPVESASNMKSWFDTVRNDVLSQLQETKSISKYKELVYDGSMKIHTTSELQNETEIGDY
ncbi:hypothetical protein LIER_15509 [Lithospermum erythrorhizon]|uniref:Uncharacterized protein n=1 Tax=Lithospermum erythrorhizon TaxID=34254 RepID=A0AAV3Q550_LITER